MLDICSLETCLAETNYSAAVAVAVAARRGQEPGGTAVVGGGQVVAVVVSSGCLSATLSWAARGTSW
ncbi:MAG: hypothetical protein HYR88_05185 [Verrucomicrobia bacterium]|nr:hypothetical protein [Verrucomicrobiota bacterium]